MGVSKSKVEAAQVAAGWRYEQMLRDSNVTNLESLHNRNDSVFETIAIGHCDAILAQLDCITVQHLWRPSSSLPRPYRWRSLG